MKRTKKALSLVMILILMFVSYVLPSNAAAGDYDFCNDLEGQLTFQGFSMDELRYDTVNGSEYVFIVENGEATILNVQINYWGPEKIPFVFPEKLGGYPVTTIGCDDRKYSVEVFLYLKYGDDFVSENHKGWAEYDPSLLYISEVIIPEGYKYIKDEAFFGVTEKITFPRSLRSVTGRAFDYLYTHINENNEKCLVLPECSVSLKALEYSIACGGHNKFVTLPSRVDSSRLVDCIRGYNNSIYFPSNYEYNSILNCFYYFEAAAGDSGEIWPISGTNMTLHCAPDSEFLQVFEDYKLPSGLTIVTDVIPAEYIAFPSDVVNVNVGEVMDLEAKTYPAEAIWTACDYTVSDPSIVKIDEYSGRITALKEGTVTVTATHCERGYVDTCTVNVTTKPAPGVNGIEPATDTPYVTYGNRDYKVNVTGSPSKIQVVRDNGGTTTIDRRKATVTSNGDTETWIVNMRVEAGTHNIRAKYGTVWDDKLTPFTVKYDLPGAYSFDLTYENGIGNFNVVTDPEITKIQFALDNGCTLTYSQTNSYIGEDGLRHWEISRKIPSDTIYTLRTKYGYTWTDTNFEVNTIM